ncbi:Pep3/Vps18/deep orange family-domain-containing protein [Boeremia exigua]|uniref:Pep3/Vps18/deep orange family-domain-containing protein n=1 Tax=Boeremia exigua TaxID=749465 RepID=UPI001E8E4867|nr:Pep3/Vps18/deep orange family-domain-containing protein [Boeremia exigua]KAH6622436.1 Pep3/Vps18/deep orange family-domain-containing protein [Boeremia exigua]
MAYDTSSGYAPPSTSNAQDDASLPMFSIERVSLQFSISSDFVAAAVANNVLVLALSTGRILRIDLDSPADIDDIDLPKKPSEIGVIRRLFLDPSASHLVVTTTLAENYYLHTQSRTPKALSRLKGVVIESISWNPSQPTASTREILVGASDGNVYEVFIEPSSEFYRREERYLKSVYNTTDGPVTGLWTDIVPGRQDLRRVIIATPSTFIQFAGKVGRNAHEGSGSIFSKFFETESATVHELPNVSSTATSLLAVSPENQQTPDQERLNSERIFGWLTSQGVLHGKLYLPQDTSDLGAKVLADSKLLPRSQIPASQTASGRTRRTNDAVSSMILSQWHILQLVDGRVVVINRLDDTVVFDQAVLEPGQSALSLVADIKSNTYWLFTTREIFEIVVTDEARDVWKIMLRSQQFEAASQFAKTSSQKDAVATASGDYLVGKGQYLEAAAVYGRSTKPFEQVALTFIDQGDQDALRKYLLTKLSTLKKAALMQRTMVATWLIELYMAKLNTLDDTITTKAELSESMNTAETQDHLSAIRKDYQDFASKYKTDLDRKTAYDIISSHGREEELLYFATVVNDYNYVLSYWVQRERWPESLAVLKKQTDAEIFYKYSSVLMAQVPVELVEIMMRQTNLDAQKLIPAFLNYNNTTKAPLSQNQAVRYLLFEINQHHSTDAAVHNTLISLYASHPTTDESALLAYLEAQSLAHEQHYDADFALRLCIQHARVQSCVHIYTSMGQYARAVDLALAHSAIELASSVAERATLPTPGRKKLWLAIARAVITSSPSIAPAIAFLRRCPLLRIEDLIPFFPDFVRIDAFKDEICAALEGYSRAIDALKSEMDDSEDTARHIASDIKALGQRYAVVRPGERCAHCALPLLSRMFFVFPCQHAFHADCLAKRVVELSGIARGKQIRELQGEVARGGGRRERAVRELDALVGSACVLCSELAVKLVDEPFITAADDREEWAL